MAFISPGAYWRELDFSEYAPSLASTRYGVLGGATWGPEDEPTVITNENDMTLQFGKPVASDYGLHSGLHYLRRGNQLMYCRVGNNAQKADAIVLENGSSATNMTITAKYSGSRGNNIQVTIANGTTAGKYKVTVVMPLDDEGLVTDTETFYDLDYTTTSKYFMEDAVNDGVYAEMNKSRYIEIDVEDGATAPTLGTYTLGQSPNTAGTDGITGLTSADYIGLYTGQSATGLKAFANAEILDVNLLAVPGVTDASVLFELLSTCETRADAMAIIDPRWGLNTNEVVTWHNDPAETGGNSLNSSYGALYWPWIQAYDAYTQKDMWFPPNGFVAAQMAYNDYIAAPWFAPAGLNRGAIRSGLKLEMSPDSGQRDTLYGFPNSINPIVNFNAYGITIWGNQTLQRKTSALRDINVRRGLLYFEKIVATSVLYLVFDPNDPVTQKRFTNLVSPVAEDIKKRRGFYDFRVICDESTNPDIAIDRKEMYGKVLIKPTRAAEKIVVDFAVLASGAEFAEY